MYNMAEDDMVIKRNGKKEAISFDKISKRLKNLGKDVTLQGSPLTINYTQLVQKICDRLYDGISTTLIDELTAQQCASLITSHPDYGDLASRILISNHQKNTPSSFYKANNMLYSFKDINDKHHPIIKKEQYEFIKQHKQQLEEMIDYKRDYLIDYFGFKTLERAYLLKVNGKIVERPQHMWLRVAVCIHLGNLEKIKTTYDLMSQKYFTHATPTLFNAGTPRPQLSSCYLIAMESDSIKGIYNTLGECAAISKWAGGIGLHIHNIRSEGSHIRGTNGTSNGIVPMLRVFNNTARYVDQCILPETYIYTINGPKQIQYCTNDDIIYNNNEDGINYEQIQNILEHSYDGDILSIHTTHSIEPLTITEEHPVFVLKNQKKGLNYKTIHNRLKNKLITPTWEESKNITEDDLIIYNIPSYEKNIENISEEDCYIYGVILGDGCISNKETTCYISLHKTEKKHILDSLTKYFTNKCIRYNITTVNNTVRFRWSKHTLLPFKFSEIYDINNEKILHSRWLNLPINKAKYILKGLIDTDGSNSQELVFDTTSRHLAESLKYICLRMGVLTSGYIRDRRGETHVSKYGSPITNKKISYCIRIPKTETISNLLNIEKGKFFKFFKHNNYLFSRIKSIEKKTYSGTLYDLQMKDNHNYMIHNGIIHNGGGKRAGSFAIYIEPWHGDIMEFLEMKKNHGDEEARARDLFYALWIPDLFMKRVSENGVWTLMCPDKCPGLADCYGEEFNTLYEKYEKEGRGNITISARDVWFKILDSQMETGTPYLLYKNACNKKSNQKNLGTIKSSNLCTEIIEYSNENETAVCNLASLGLSNFVINTPSPFSNVTIYTKDNCKWCTLMKSLLTEKNITYTEHNVTKNDFDEFKNKFQVETLPLLLDNEKKIGGFTDILNILRSTFDYKKLHEVTKIVVENLNNVIDINFYPTPKTKTSNMKHRPIGLGVQGLADVFALMNYPFHSNEAKIINKKIFHTIYHAALESSMELSKKSSPYITFKGSPASNGILQFDMWENFDKRDLDLMGYNWDKLKHDIKTHGLVNSLLVAPMPTASTSQILGNNECFEPFTSNIYVRRTIAGEFICVNKHLLNDLIRLNLWNEETKNKIIRNGGSIQNLSHIPKFIKEKYKIVWEIPMKHIIEMSADRGVYICQSQSMNLWMKDPNYKKLTSMHFFSWRKGLKTGLYYLRTEAKAAPQQFTIEPKDLSKNNEEKTNSYEEEDCLMCGS